MRNIDIARMTAFHALDRQQQREAITRLAVLGMSEHTIASATHLSVEMVRLLLGSSRESSSQYAHDQVTGGA